ncbi:hypothetical protein MMH89_03755 [Candidatus Comchoanobacter bicostacola]|uniref:Uncharacterized protein n=1 Tax=Candidatus Comchoanobacter bicostacola TaxID=2919598 RepID=A0ABY5DJF2_9GAMM|nr:hypothetical protein [Candidatus Comchoanobacter bicostacola]UTC24335.1 hypothetical protein MMH89_03755 [Candidatus Comchoanobacter bicostacola]
MNMTMRELLKKISDISFFPGTVEQVYPNDVSLGLDKAQARDHVSRCIEVIDELLVWQKDEEHLEDFKILASAFKKELFYILQCTPYTCFRLTTVYGDPGIIALYNTLSSEKEVDLSLTREVHAFAADGKNSVYIRKGSELLRDCLGVIPASLDIDTQRRFLIEAMKKQAESSMGKNSQLYEVKEGDDWKSILVSYSLVSESTSGTWIRSVVASMGYDYHSMPRVGEHVHIPSEYDICLQDINAINTHIFSTDGLLLNESVIQDTFAYALFKVVLDEGLPPDASSIRGVLGCMGLEAGGAAAGDEGVRSIDAGSLDKVFKNLLGLCRGFLMDGFFSKQLNSLCISLGKSIARGYYVSCAQGVCERLQTNVGLSAVDQAGSALGRRFEAFAHKLAPEDTEGIIADKMYKACMSKPGMSSEEKWQVFLDSLDTLDKCLLKMVGQDLDEYKFDGLYHDEDLFGNSNITTYSDGSEVKVPLDSAAGQLIVQAAGWNSQIAFDELMGGIPDNNTKVAPYVVLSAALEGSGYERGQDLIDISRIGLDEVADAFLFGRELVLHLVHNPLYSLDPAKYANMLNYINNSESDKEGPEYFYRALVVMLANIDNCQDLMFATGPIKRAVEYLIGLSLGGVPARSTEKALAFVTRYAKKLSTGVLSEYGSKAMREALSGEWDVDTAFFWLSVGADFKWDSAHGSMSSERSHFHSKYYERSSKLSRRCLEFSGESQAEYLLRLLKNDEGYNNYFTLGGAREKFFRQIPFRVLWDMLDKKGRPYLQSQYTTWRRGQYADNEVCSELKGILDPGQRDHQDRGTYKPSSGSDVSSANSAPGRKRSWTTKVKMFFKAIWRWICNLFRRRPKLQVSSGQPVHSGGYSDIPEQVSGSVLSNGGGNGVDPAPRPVAGVMG